MRRSLQSIMAVALFTLTKSKAAEYWISVVALVETATF